MPRPIEAEFLYDVLKGDRAAVAFCQQLFMVSQVLDDLYDGDDVSKEQIIKAFWVALIDLNFNPFFKQHRDELIPIMQAAFVDWIDASELETGTEHERNIAFVLRDSIGNIVSHCALLIGGFDWMRSTSMDVRRHIFEDRLEHYKQELTKCQAAERK